MLSISSGERPTTVGVVGPSSVETALREARSAVKAEVSVTGVDVEDGVPERVDCVVAAPLSEGAERTDGGTPAPPDVEEWVTETAAEMETPVILLGPPEAAVTEALRAGVAEYVPRSVLERSPQVTLERALGAARDHDAGADYRAIYDNVSEPLTLHDPETGELVHANERLCELLGYDRAEIVAMRVADYTADIEGYDQASAMELITSATEDGVVGPVEWPLETAEGDQVWVESTLRPVEVAGRELVLSTATDVTDRRRQRRQFREITDHIEEVVYLARADLSEALFVNEAYTDLFGQPAERVLEDPYAVLEAVHPEDREAYRADLQAMSEHVQGGAGEPYEFTHRLRVGGETRWVEVTGSPSRGPGGDVDRVVGVIRDVTERVRREREYEQIFDGVNNAITVHEPDTAEMVDANETFCELLGYDREAVLEMEISEFSRADLGYTTERGRSFIAGVLEDGPDQTEWALETADGETVWVEVHGTVAEIGGQRRFVAIDRDITEAKRREREYEQIFNAVNDSIVVHDLETGELVDANDTFCELVGYDRDRVLELGTAGVSVESEGYTEQQAREVIERVREEGELDALEWKVETADGEHRLLDVTATRAEIGGESRHLSLMRDVTERRRREREYEQIFDGVNDAIAVHDPETGEILDVNESYLELYDYDRETILERDISDLSVTEEGYTDERARELVRSVAEDGTERTVEWRIETADGEHRTVEANLTVAEIGGERRVLSLIRDVTERVRREREYEQIFDGVTDIVAVHDPETAEMVDVNSTLCELTGYDRETVLEQGADGLVVDHPDADHPPAAVSDIIDRVMDGETVSPYEQVLETADGDHVWIEVNPTRAEIGGKQRFLAISRDITERVRREREYEQIFNGVPGPITINDPETGELLAVNDALCEVLGYDRETILDLGNEGLVAEEPGYDGDRAREIVRRVMETGESETFEWKLETADGETRVLEVTGRPAEIGGERRYVSLTRDITEQRRREREFEQIFNGVTDIINVYDPERGELLDVNDTMCDLLGYDRETILEGGPEAVSATELGYEREAVERVVEEVAETGEPARGLEWALRTASGETLWTEVNATPAEVNGRQRVLAIARDVTERRDREERVQVLNRVLRHNLRNDMDAIQGYATAIEENVEEERPREHARRIAETAEGLLRLSGKARSTEAVLRGDERRTTEPVERVLETVVAEAREQFEDVFAVETAAGAEAAPVEAAVFRLVLGELVENAAEHGDGPVEVRAIPATDGDGLTVEVADEGPGIPDEALTPFRTGGETQFEHNHGLGLWLVNWGVRRLGGNVEFDRLPGGGTVARLRLPAIEE